MNCTKIVRLRIHDPCCITSRLLPGIKIGEAYISIEYADRPGRDGRTRYRYFIDILDVEEYSDDDLQSGCQGGSLQSGLGGLLAMLGACGDSVDFTNRTGEESDNGDLFPEVIGQWASENSDELSTGAMELEETPDVIQELKRLATTNPQESRQ